MADETKAIAAKVRGVAGEYRLSQEAVAQIIGLADRKAVGARYQGRVPFSASEIFRFAQATGEPITRFYPALLSPSTPTARPVDDPPVSAGRATPVSEGRA